MHPPALHSSDYWGPVIGALVFMSLMSLVKEPVRHRLNATLAAGAAGVYMSGGLGPWELAFVVVASTVAYFGAGSYRLIACAWWLHAAWDVVHHLYAQPIWPFMATSSFGCALFDTLIALWFWSGAPVLWKWPRGARERVLSAPTD